MDRFAWIVSSVTMKRSLLIAYLIMTEVMFRPKKQITIVLANLRGRSVAIQTYFMHILVYLCVFLPDLSDIETGRIEFFGIISHSIVFGLIVFGFIIRFWSMIMIKDGEGKNLLNRKPMLMTTGPFNYLRHPGYFGSLLVWGGCLTGYFMNWMISSAIMAIVLNIMKNKCNNEEEYLLVEYPTIYPTYQSRVTTQLIPFVY